MSMSLEGKTIVRAADLGYDGQALVFTDGTAAHFQGTGYETDGCSLDTLASEMDVLHMEAKLEDQRRRDAVTRERNIARRELKERIQRNVSPQAWLNWKRVHVSPMEDLVEGVYLQMASDLNRQFVGRTAVVPIEKARRS